MSKLQKSHYKDGQYFDVTTNTFYTPKDRCELCGISYPLDNHHFLSQSRCLRDLKANKTRTPKTWTQEFINEHQKIFTVCRECHNILESKSWTQERFYQKYGKNKSDYIYEDYTFG